MSRNRGRQLLPNPLSPEQRKVMYELSRFAKNEDLLEGWQRKFLFQAGRFDEWFMNRFSSYSDILQELLPDLTPELSGKASEAIEVIDSIEIGEGAATLSDTDLEINQLRFKSSQGNATPPERLQLAELLERVGELTEAGQVAAELFKEFPKNKTVEKLYIRLGVKN